MRRGKAHGKRLARYGKTAAYLDAALDRCRCRRKCVVGESVQLGLVCVGEVVAREPHAADLVNLAADVGYLALQRVAAQIHLAAKVKACDVFLHPFLRGIPSEVYSRATCRAVGIKTKGCEELVGIQPHGGVKTRRLAQVRHRVAVVILGDEQRVEERDEVQNRAEGLALVVADIYAAAEVEASVLVYAEVALGRRYCPVGIPIEVALGEVARAVKTVSIHAPTRGATWYVVKTYFIDR